MQDDMDPRYLEFWSTAIASSIKLQKCNNVFLYCSLYPDDTWSPRDELIEYFIDEKLIDGRKSKES